MGILKHKDVFTGRYTTAIIRDSNDRGYFVPIKKPLDDYFITNLNGNLYAFSMENARIITHREFLSRSVQWIDFDTSHYRSMQKYYKELELVLEKNQLPRMNRMQLALLTMLGKKEKIYDPKTNKAIVYSRSAFQQKVEDAQDKLNIPVGEKGLRLKPYEMQLLIQDLKNRQEDFPEEAENLINFIEDLPIDHLVTPVKKLSEYLQEDLITTKSSFLGEVTPRLQRVDYNLRTVMNRPKTATIPYLKMILIGAVLFGLMFLIWTGIEQGWFDQLMAGFPNSSGFGTAFQTPQQRQASQDCSDTALQKKYPEPIELKIAINEGKETCKLSPKMQKLVDGVELPKVEAKP